MFQTCLCYSFASSDKIIFYELSGLCAMAPLDLAMVDGMRSGVSADADIEHMQVSFSLNHVRTRCLPLENT